MAIYVYFEANHLNNVDRHRLTPAEETYFHNRARQIEKNQNLMWLDFYSNKAFKLTHHKLRCVGWYYRMEEDDILLVCTHLFERGRTNYLDFLEEVNGRAERPRYMQPDQESQIFKLAASWYQQQKTSNQRQELPPLSAEEQIYMSKFTLTLPSADSVYETQEWCDAIERYFFMTADELERQQRYAELLLLHERLSGLQWTTDRHECIPFGDRYVEYMFRADPEKGTRTVTLINFKETDSKDAYYGLNRRDPVRQSKRVYERDLLLPESQERWARLQKYQKSSLAFSPEQVKVLQEALDPNGVNSAPRLPLFIKGSAGSGKTTILYYLYQQFLSKYFEWSKDSKNVLKPLYLSYSERLIDHAKRHISDLLCEQTGEEPPSLDSFFVDFISFLKRYLTDEEAETKFADLKRVYYFRFKQEFERSFHVGHDTKYTADLVWSIIRTFIKGYQWTDQSGQLPGNSDYLEVDDYAELPDKWKPVSDEEYSEIYNRYFKNWYLNRFSPAENYWDDQDLVRYVMSTKTIKPEYGALFADEVQDFTNLEFLFLLKLTPYYQRKIQPHQLSQIPFVYVGDAYQTIQPTGFDWKYVCANYFKRFIEPLNPFELGRHVSVRAGELEFNYRSAPAIVHFSNTVQKLRATWLGQTKLDMQKAWKLDSEFRPYVFVSTDIGQDHEIWQVGPEIIIPVDDYIDNSEDDLAVTSIVQYVKQDDFFRPIIRVNDQRQTAQSVWNSVKIKGLEFPEVIIYGFGQYFVDRKSRWFPERATNGREGDSRDSTVIFKQEKEYFINKLYVAATRPSKNLIIVDTQAGLEQFWLNPEVFPREKHDLLLYPERGYMENLKYDGSVPLEQRAAEMEKNAEEQSSVAEKAELYRRAWQLFDSAAKPVDDADKLEQLLADAARCDSLAEYYQLSIRGFDNSQEWQNVLQMLADSQQHELYLQAAWNLGDYLQMTEYANHHETPEVWQARLAFAQLLTNQADVAEHKLQILQHLRQLLRVKDDVGRTPATKEVIRFLSDWLQPMIDRSLKTPDEDLMVESDLLKKIIELLEKLAPKNALFNDLLGGVYLLLEDYAKTSDVWNKIKDGKLRSLYFRLFEDRKIYVDFMAKNGRNFSQEEIRRLAVLLKTQNQEQELLELFRDNDAFAVERFVLSNPGLSPQTARAIVAMRVHRVNVADKEAWKEYETEMVQTISEYPHMKEELLSALEHIIESRKWNGKNVEFAEQLTLTQIVKLWHLIDPIDNRRISALNALRQWFYQNNYKLSSDNPHLEAKKMLDSAANNRKFNDLFEFIYLRDDYNSLQFSDKQELTEAIKQLKHFMKIIREYRFDEWYRLCLNNIIEHLREIRLEIASKVKSSIDESQYALYESDIKKWVEKLKKTAQSKVKNTSMSGMSWVERYETIQLRQLFRLYSIELDKQETQIENLMNVKFLESKDLIKDTLESMKKTILSLLSEQSLMGAAEKLKHSVSNNFEWKNKDLKTSTIQALQAMINQLSGGHEGKVSQFHHLQEVFLKLVDLRKFVAEDKAALLKHELQKRLSAWEKKLEEMKQAKPVPEEEETKITELPPDVIRGKDGTSAVVVEPPTEVIVGKNVYDVMAVLAGHLGNPELSTERYQMIEATMFRLKEESNASSLKM